MKKILTPEEKEIKAKNQIVLIILAYSIKKLKMSQIKKSKIKKLKKI